MECSESYRQRVRPEFWAGSLDVLGLVWPELEALPEPDGRLGVTFWPGRLPGVEGCPGAGREGVGRVAGADGGGVGRVVGGGGGGVDDPYGGRAPGL